MCALSARRLEGPLSDLDSQPTSQEDGADKFKAMTEALTKYEDFPGEETQKQHQQLKEHWDAVL